MGLLKMRKIIVLARRASERTCGRYAGPFQFINNAYSVRLNGSLFGVYRSFGASC